MFLRLGEAVLPVAQLEQRDVVVLIPVGVAIAALAIVAAWMRRR